MKSYGDLKQLTRSLLVLEHMLGTARDVRTDWDTFTLEKAAFGSGVVDAFLFGLSRFYGNLTQARSSGKKESHLRKCLCEICL